MRIFMDLGLTVAMASGLASVILILSDYIHLPIVPEQRSLFFIGVVLFALATRLLMSLREEESKG